LPGAVGRMAAFGIGPLIAASAGIVLMGLLRTPLRWFGAVVLGLAGGLGAGGAAAGYPDLR
jgi:competence protein ComEC